MSYGVEFAKAFLERDNIPVDEPFIGDVINVNPVEVSAFEGKVKLSGGLIELSGDFCIISGTCEVDGREGICKIDRSLKIGEKVKCIPTCKGQKYFIMR